AAFVTGGGSVGAGVPATGGASGRGGCPLNASARINPAAMLRKAPPPARTRFHGNGFGSGESGVGVGTVARLGKGVAGRVFTSACGRGAVSGPAAGIT